MKSALIATLALALAGCSASRALRLQQNRESVEKWPAEMQHAVKQGTILKGMSSEMVRIAWGNPKESSSDPSGVYQYWLYPAGDRPALKVDAFPHEAGVDNRPASDKFQIVLSKAEPASTSMIVFQYDLVLRVEQVRRRL